jgi:flagellin-like hook-associated protein FlgL
MIINSSTTTPYNNLPPTPARPSKPPAPASATAGIDQAQISSTGEQLAVGNDNFTAVDSPIQDMDAANAAAEFARNSILGQPALAMQAQAGSIPLSALHLLQE